MTALDAARLALRERQGQGARYDAPEAPAEDLAQVRLGTAYFARVLSGLPDAALAAPSAVPGCSRAGVVARVSLHARGISWQIEAGGSEAEGAHDPGAAAYLADVGLSATLPARALRHLFDHSAIHLDVVWRDLPGPAWAAPARAADGCTCPMRGLVAERACLIWQAALDLAAGARLRDLPARFRPVA